MINICYTMMNCVIRMLYGESYTSLKTKEQEEYDPYQTPRNAFLRKITNPWGKLSDSINTHHVFGGTAQLEKRLSPVMYGIQEITSLSKNGVFCITFDALNKVDSPLLTISNIYVEHSSPITKLVYQGGNVHPILLQTQYVIGGRSMTLIQNAGYRRCFRGDTTGHITVEVTTKDMQNDDIKLHVEYVQATGSEKGLLHDKNKCGYQSASFQAARDMTHSCNGTYVHKCFLQKAFIVGCIIAVKDQYSSCSGITAYVKKPTAEEDATKNDCTSENRQIINSVSGTLARVLFTRDPVQHLIDKGYTCYALPFTSESMHTTFEKEKCLPMGSISLQSIKDEGSDLVIEVDFERKLAEPPVFIAVLAGHTPYYI